MSAISFWICPTLKGDSCSTGERYFTTRADTLSKERDSCAHKACSQSVSHHFDHNTKPPNTLLQSRSNTVI